ncbi:hypothetical protein CapIbe_021037 [Capra ibex]
MPVLHTEQTRPQHPSQLRRKQRTRQRAPALGDRGTAGCRSARETLTAARGPGSHPSGLSHAGGGKDRTSTNEPPQTSRNQAPGFGPAGEEFLRPIAAGPFLHSGAQLQPYQPDLPPEALRLLPGCPSLHRVTLEALRLTSTAFEPLASLLQHPSLPD